MAWVDLAPVRDPNAVMAAIASALGLDRPVSSTPELIAALQEAFGDGRFLLVLDNFEQVIAAAPAIAALLVGTPALTALVTSRAPLRLAAEREHPVAPLAVPEPETPTRRMREVESVRLFVARARAVQPDFTLESENSEAVARICRRLDGFPLAIELAASRVNVLAPAELLERLEQRLPLLTRGTRDAPARQQTMRDTIAWSYNLLEPEAQRLFRLLSVFVGGVSLDTVEWVLGREVGTAAVDALTTLVEHSLVYRLSEAGSGARFTMYETIREFGLTRLAEHQEREQAYDLLADYCRSLARYGDGIPTCIVPAPWLTLLDQERGNIRAAYHYLAQSGDPAKLAEFTVAFGNYLYNRGPIQEAWEWFERALDSAASQPAPLRLQVFYWASHLASHLGMAERAVQLGHDALALAEDHGDPSWRAAIVHCLGIVHAGCGCHDRAAALFEEELRLWREAGVTGLSGFALMMLGEDAYLRGDLATARSLEAKAGAIFAEMGGFGWVAKTKWFGGLFSIAEGDLSAAAMQFRDSLRLSVDHHTSLIHHQGLIGLAYVASELALYERAGQLLGAAAACLEPVGHDVSGVDKSLFDQASAACRSALGAGAFEDACRRGAASDHLWWLESGEVIMRAAANRAGDSSTTDWIAESDRSQLLRSHVAAD